MTEVIKGEIDGGAERTSHKRWETGGGNLKNWRREYRVAYRVGLRVPHGERSGCVAVERNLAGEAASPEPREIIRQKRPEREKEKRIDTRRTGQSGLGKMDSGSTTATNRPASLQCNSSHRQTRLTREIQPQPSDGQTQTSVCGLTWCRE